MDFGQILAQHRFLVWSLNNTDFYVYMGRFPIGQHFFALSVTKTDGIKLLLLLNYCIYVQKVKFPLILVLTPRFGCLQTQKILPGNVCRKVTKFPENPGNLNW